MYRWEYYASLLRQIDIPSHREPHLTFPSPPCDLISCRQAGGDRQARRRGKVMVRLRATVAEEASGPGRGGGVACRRTAALEVADGSARGRRRWHWRWMTTTWVPVG
jgi:hypothetical protein